MRKQDFYFQVVKALAPINRAYYSMFYAVLALLVYEPYSSSKHSGVLSYFNKRFIKEGVFEKSIGRSINKAFELRQRGDYREYIELTSVQVEPLINEAEVFIKTVKDYLESKKGSESPPAKPEAFILWTAQSGTFKKFMTT